MNRNLEIGPGDCPLVGKWDTLDVHPVVPVTYVARWGLEPLPIDGGRYDLVFSSHAIEHVPWYHTIDAFKEVYRILKPNGRFEVWTVDFDVIVQSYLKKEWVENWDCGGRIHHWMQSIAGRTFAYEKNGNAHMWHKALFNRSYLKLCLVMAGFSIDRMGNLEKSRGHDHGIINLGVWATK